MSEDDRPRDADYFEGEYAQAATALEAIATQAPLLVATGNVAELHGFIDRFVAMAEKAAADATAHGQPEAAGRFAELARAAQALRTAGQN